MLYTEMSLISSNLIIREWLNGSLFPLSFFLTFAVVTFINDTRLEIGRGWARAPGIPTACALAWVFLCETIRAGGVWFILRLQNDGHVVPIWIQKSINGLFIFAAFALILVILRCTYLFSPPRWGNRYWVLSAIVTAWFLLISHFTPSLGF